MRRIYTIKWIMITSKSESPIHIIITIWSLNSMICNFLIYSALQLLEQYLNKILHDCERSLTIIVAVLYPARFRYSHLDNFPLALPLYVGILKAFYPQPPSRWWLLLAMAYKRMKPRRSCVLQIYQTPTSRQIPRRRWLLRALTLLPGSGRSWPVFWLLSLHQLDNLLC